MIIEPYEWHDSEITEIARASINTITVRIRRPAAYGFAAGQYAIVRAHLDHDVRLMRQYSFSSSPSVAWLEFTIQHEPGGDVTTWFHEQAQVGDILQISQPFGNFTYPSTTRPLLFIAGRVGIAPFMSYLRERGSAGNVHVIYSVRTDEETCFWDELRGVTTRVISSAQQRIDKALLAPYTDNKPIAYICGSRQFAEAMQAHLSKLGLPPEDIRRELFTL